MPPTARNGSPATEYPVLRAVSGLCEGGANRADRRIPRKGSDQRNAALKTLWIASGEIAEYLLGKMTSVFVSLAHRSATYGR